MIKIILSAISVLGMIFMFASGVRADEGLRLGKWEITSSNAINGNSPTNAPSTMEVHSNIQNGVDNVTVNNGNSSGSFSAPVQENNNPNFKMINSSMDAKTDGSNETANVNATSTVCITPENRIPFQKMPNCETPQVTTNGNTIDIHAVCNMAGVQMDMTSHIEYTDDTLVMDNNSHMNSNGHEGDMKSHATGRYLGPC